MAVVLAAGAAFAADPAVLLKNACSSCHDLGVINTKQATKEEWSAVVKAMIDKGAALKPAEAAAITNYLATNHGKLSPAKEARAKELVDGICILCHEFARISTEELTKDQWAGEIRGMVDEGAPLNDDEFEIVVDYLTEHYGVKEQ